MSKSKSSLSAPPPREPLSPDVLAQSVVDAAIACRMEIARLSSENAALQARLDGTAIPAPSPPCPPGSRHITETELAGLHNTVRLYGETRQENERLKAHVATLEAALAERRRESVDAMNGEEA